MLDLLLEAVKKWSTERKIMGTLGLYAVSRLVKVFGALHWDNFKLKRSEAELLQIKEKYLQETRNKELWLLRMRKEILLKELGLWKKKKK